jgi:hypothetical protein
VHIEDMKTLTAAQVEATKETAAPKLTAAQVRALRWFEGAEWDANRPTTRTTASLVRRGLVENLAVVAERKECAEIVRAYARPPAWIESGAAEGIASAILARGATPITDAGRAALAAHEEGK